MTNDLSGDAKGIKSVTTVDMKRNENKMWDVKIHVVFSVTKDLVQWEELKFESFASDRDPGIAYKKALEEILTTELDVDGKTSLVL